MKSAFDFQYDAECTFQYSLKFSKNGDKFKMYLKTPLNLFDKKMLLERFCVHVDLCLLYSV